MKKFKGHFSGPSNPSHQTRRKGFHWTPEGHCGCLVYFFEHDPQQYDFKNYNWYVCFKNELLHLQKEKSRTCSNFEIFDHDPQLDIKFWNLTSNFETHKNIGENFDYMYRYMYTLSMYRKGINIIEGYFGYKKWTFRPKKKKNHLPAVILKFLTTTPNLTWNFETHKNIGDNFYFVYKYTYT